MICKHNPKEPEIVILILYSCMFTLHRYLLAQSGFATCSLSRLTASYSVVGRFSPLGRNPAGADWFGGVPNALVGEAGEYCDAGENNDKGLAFEDPLPLLPRPDPDPEPEPRLLMDLTISETGRRWDKSGCGIGKPDGTRGVLVGVGVETDGAKETVDEGVVGARVVEVESGGPMGSSRCMSVRRGVDDCPIVGTNPLLHSGMGVSIVETGEAKSAPSNTTNPPPGVPLGLTSR